MQNILSHYNITFIFSFTKKPPSYPYKVNTYSYCSLHTTNVTWTENGTDRPSLVTTLLKMETDACKLKRSRHKAVHCLDPPSFYIFLLCLFIPKTFKIMSFYFLFKRGLFITFIRNPPVIFTTVTIKHSLVTSLPLEFEWISRSSLVKAGLYLKRCFEGGVVRLSNVVVLTTAGFFFIQVFFISPVFGAFSFVLP